MACIAVGVRSSDAPELLRVETGRYRWLSRQWVVGGVDEVERDTAAPRLEARFVEWNGEPIRYSVKTAFNSAAAQAGLEGRVTAHTLRHTAASCMQAGIDKWGLPVFLVCRLRCLIGCMDITIPIT